MSMMALLVLAASNTLAAEKTYEVKNRVAIMEDGQCRHETRRVPRGFRIKIVNDEEGIKPESAQNGRPFITARKGERYSVRLYNPLPVRVAVNLTVDGLNSITGKPSGISDGHKWMIDPHSFITVPGWQVNGAEARRFFFTDKPKSYAQWRGETMGRDLAANCGVIGAAFFWNQGELDRYYDAHPIYRHARRAKPYRFSAEKSMGALSSGAPSNARQEAADSLGAEPQEQAGTGMGERESHPTVQVAFHYDTGMYKLSQALVVYYGFESKPVPNPFPDLGYAPEMN
jgi:hypothetical protein